MKAEYENIIQTNYRSPEDIELVLGLLRKQGATQIESVKGLVDVLGFALTDADDLVLNSSTWQDRREGNDRLRDAFFDSIEDGA